MHNEMKKDNQNMLNLTNKIRIHSSSEDQHHHPVHPQPNAENNVLNTQLPTPEGGKTVGTPTLYLST
jgi:hypothetical protein